LDNQAPPLSPRHKEVKKGADQNQRVFSNLLGLKGFLLFCFILYFLGFFLIAPAEAGIFSFIEKILGGSDANSNQPEMNSQNIPLSRAPLNSSLPAAIGSGDMSGTIVGQSAILSVIGPEGSMADIEEKRSPDQISIYIVQEGDNLAGIANMFDVSVNTIMWANNLNRGDLITVGQTLVILPVSGISYTVKKGDTIESIAKKWKGDANEIIQFNDLSPNQTLAVGSTVIIPNGEAPLPSNYAPPSIYRGGSGTYYAGYYIRPISGGRKSQGLHGYNGIDLANSCGTPIMASASGDVIISRSGGWNGGYGNFTIIDHSNGTQTLYAHMSSVIVSAGWHVVQGQVIGYIGLSGNTTGCHVHFEIRGAKNPF